MEPCCISRTLPPLLRQYQWLPWQSNGDVTIDKIFKAVSHLAGDRLTITLALPAVDTAVLRLLTWYWQRGWLTSAAILTATDQTQFIRSGLPREMAVTIASHDSVESLDGMVWFQGEKSNVVVTGPLLTAVTPGLCTYNTYFGADAARISQLTDAVTSRIRVAVAKESKKTSTKRATAKKVEQAEPDDSAIDTQETTDDEESV